MRLVGLSGLLCLALLAFRPAPAQALTPPSNEIKVSLFGQPCLLRGPTDEKTLKLIHSLSPEQLYPERDSPLTSAPTRTALEKLKAVSGAPTGLDRYRDRLAKRLEAQLAVLEAFEKYEKDRKTASILAAGKSYMTPIREKEFVAAVKKAEAAKTLSKSDTLDALFDSYSDGIEADPEEEFHRAIQRLNVQYACSFEETKDPAGTPDGASAR
jgi:hypothetical protein